MAWEEATEEDGKQQWRVWPQSWRAPSVLCQLDMGKSWNAIIHANYWCAQIEEENR